MRGDLKRPSDAGRTPGVLTKQEEDTMANEMTELERKVKAIDRINRRINKVLDKKNLGGADRAAAFNALFRRSLDAWGVSEDEYLDVSLKQSQ